MNDVLLVVIASVMLIAIIALSIYVRKLIYRIKELEHTAALIDSAPYYIAYDDNVKSDLYANREAYKMTGRAPTAPLSKESTHDEAGMRLLFEEAFPAVEMYGTWVGENTLLHSDGHLIDVQQFIFPVRDKHGHQLGTATLMRDISEEKKMRRSLEIQLALMNSSSNFVVALDTEFKAIYANPALKKISGYEDIDLDDLVPELFHEPETCKKIRESWSLALNKGTAELESEFIRRNGERIFVNHIIFAIKNDQGTVTGIGSIVSDITELKRIQQDLIKSKEIAETASRAKSIFLSNMSHEIRTPMNAIIGMTKIAMSTSDPAKIFSSLEKVAASSEHLLNIINDILDLSKIDSGKLELYNTNFSVDKVVSNAVGIIENRAEAKSQSLTVDIAQDIPPLILGDANRFSQVLINLLSNAVKFTGDNGHIALEVHSALEDGHVRLDIVVSDDGIGMDEDQQSKLFNAFEQTSISITSKYGGTGLGLAISKRLVEMMGGSIFVKSAPGVGSKFCFNVLFEISLTEENAEEKNQQDSDDVDFSGICILLAEDIEINREVVMGILEPTNVTIDQARDGVEAVEMFRNSPGKYSLILMDIQMPRMDGFAATRAIRGEDAPCAKTIPIIAMTANAFNDDVQNCLDAGMNAHISKPIDVDIVMETICRYIQQNASQAI